MRGIRETPGVGEEVKKATCISEVTAVEVRAALGIWKDSLGDSVPVPLPALYTLNVPVEVQLYAVIITPGGILHWNCD